jgi:hypothetical protein
MWLHIPSECCPSAPDTAGSILPSDSFFQTLERSATSSGKFRRFAYWRRAWRTGGLTPLRFGMTSPHSTPPPGLAAWISSWQDSPASHTLMQENGWARRTVAGLSGSTSSALPEAVQLDLFFSRTSPVCSQVPAEKPSPASVQIWTTQALRIKQPAYWVLAMSGHLTNGIASSFWPTPNARDWKDGRPPAGYTNSRPLNEVAMAFSLPDPTPIGQSLPQDSSQRQLNPLFVEWIMGLPEGWTSLVQSDCTCSAMASCHCKPPQHLRV